MVNAKISPTAAPASASNRSSTAAPASASNRSSGHTGILHSMECFPRRRGRKMSSDSIHSALACDDILTEILFRLPEKSVFKFMLVSKRWLHLICSCSFRGCYENRWGTPSYLLGFFVCNFLYIDRPQDGLRRPPFEPALPMLSTCKEGDDLMFSGILKQLGYFIDYSHGLLLCGRHPKTYYVWNSVTKHRYQLPQPRKRYKYLCTAFMTEDSGGEIVYRVVRANCECRVDVINTISIETFSSLTCTWKQSTLVCPSDFALSPWTVGTVIKGVIHWFGTYRSLAIYDPEFGERCISSIKLPVGQLSYDYEDSVLGESSDGLVQYGQSGKLGLETWVLHKEQDSSSSSSCMVNARCEYRWELQHRLSYKDMWKQNPNSGIRSKEPQILSFIRGNSESIFIRLGSNIYRCNMKSKTLKVIPYHCDGAAISWDFCKVVPYFQQLWPHFPLGVV